MNKLVVICYEDRFQAEEVRMKLMKLQMDYLIDLEDAVVAWKTEKGKVKLSQVHDTAGAGMVSGGFWGMLVGLMFLNPLLGAAVGAGAGAVSGALADVGIDNQFMKQLSDELKPGGSALFVLVRHSTPDKVAEQLEGTGGTILQSSLTHEDEAKLQAVLDGVRKVVATT